VGEHRFKGIESSREGHRAACSCGWRSLAYGTAGMAGSVWDRHVLGEDEQRLGRSPDDGQ
jgi:hypothetical protein